MARSGFEYAERWLTGLQAAVLREAYYRALLPGRRNIAPAAEQFPGRDMFVIRYVTPGGSSWHLLY